MLPTTSVPQLLGHGLVPIRAYWEPGHTVREAWLVSKQSFISIYSHTPSFVFPPELISQIMGSIRFYRCVNPLVNCPCEGSRLHAPCENWMPDDLRWTWGGDSSTQGQLQMQIIISQEIWLHGNNNKSTTCRCIKALSVSGKWKLSCIWWQFLSQNPTLGLVCTWPDHYCICHFHLCLFLALCTCLHHSFGKLTRQPWPKWIKKKNVTGQLLGKGGNTQWWNRRL